jgi:hypothetical protein
MRRIITTAAATMTIAAVIVLCVVSTVVHAIAADISGKWQASFETQIGEQHYTYTFVVKDAKLSGKIGSDIGGETEILDGKVEGDKVTFVEIFPYQGAEIRITYVGHVTSEDSIRFTRQVEEFATEELVAKRVRP